MFNLLRKIAKGVLPEPWQIVIGNLMGMPERLKDNERNIQILGTFLLQQKYKSMAENQAHRLEINKFEVKAYSQNGEDGILLYIFSKIGTTNRCFVEFGIGDGTECNTANLSINFGWHGLLMDRDDQNVAIAKRHYQNRLGTRFSDVKIIKMLVTKENVNKVLLDNLLEREIDLLSIDIDGNDFWVWKAITGINPRVVVIEYNASMGYEKSLTVKYDQNFDRYKKHASGFYYGASLAALTKLANSKGYILVGCDSTGVNAFFVRKDAAHARLSEVSVQEAYFPFSHSRISRRLEELSISEQFECIEHLDFDHV
jgi:hypothetical protein